MTEPGVLILANDPLAAALLGGAVELAGYTAHFLRDGESPRDALRRTRAPVALVDCDHPDGCSEAFIGPAMMLGARVILVRSPRSTRDVNAMAAHLGVRVLELPGDADGIARAVMGD